MGVMIVPAPSFLPTFTAQAQGDILYRNATQWVNLGAGTSGKLLQTNGAAANPSWETVSVAAPSGTLPIANGGTGQTSQTNAFDALAPTTTQGDVMYHNGTDNVRLGPGTSGQFLKTNGAGANPAWADQSGMSLLDNGTLGGAGLTLATNTFTAKKNLRFIVRSNGTLNPTAVTMRCNGDSGSNYRWRAESNGGADTTSTGDTGVDMVIPSTTGAAFIIVDINNFAAGSAKAVIAKCNWFYTGATAPDKVVVFGVWTNTANQITSLSFVNTGGSGNWPTGTEWWVFGSD